MSTYVCLCGENYSGGEAWRAHLMVCDVKAIMRTPAVKKDTGKAPMSLLSPIALQKIAEVLEFGKDKYAAHNWRKGMDWSRMSDASLRHILAWLDGGADPESGLSHLAHAACCIMFLLEYEAKGIGKDDRYTPCEK